MILEAIDKKLLHKLLIYHTDVPKELLVEELSDPEVLEVAAATESCSLAFIEIMHFLRTGKVKATKKLVEYWRKINEEMRRDVLANLFGELASSLEGGQYDEGCRRALLRLFYFFF